MAVDLSGRVSHHYLHHFQDPRRERMFISSIGFFGGFVAARAVTHLIRSRRGPFKNLSLGGRHLHHLVFGIAGLLGTGYLWLTGVGTPQKRIARKPACASVATVSLAPVKSSP